MENKENKENTQSYFDKIIKNFESYTFILFTFILGLFSAWSWQLLPNHIIQLFEKNRQSQLVVLYGLVLFTLDYFNPELSFNEIISNTSIVFLLYLLITKQSLTFFIITVVLFVILVFISNQIQRFNILIDKEKDEQNKLNLEKNKNNFKQIYKIIVIITILSIIYGSLTYFRKQYNDHYKKGDNLFIFLLKYFFEGSKSQQLNTGTVINL